MKTSELIARLAEMLEEHGDLPVRIPDAYYDGSDYKDVAAVELFEQPTDHAVYQTILVT